MQKILIKIEMGSKGNVMGEHNEKSPSIAARAFILSWRSGRDSNPRPPA